MFLLIDRDDIIMSEPSPMMPAYQPYWSPQGDLNTLQHQTIISTINDNGRSITRDISDLGAGVAMSTSKVVDTIGIQSLGIRDAIERNALGLATGATNAASVAASTARDIQVAIERNGLTGTGVTERVGSGLMSTLERTAGETRLTNVIADAATRQAHNDSARDITAASVKGATDVLKSIADDRYLFAVSDAASRQAANDSARDIVRESTKGTTSVLTALGETRYSTAISDATTRQATNDLTRDVINNMNRGMNELAKANNDSTVSLLSTMERNGNDGRRDTTQAGFETRTLINDRHNSILIDQNRGFDRSYGQSSTQFAALLLEQHKSSDAISKELSEAKYEALKNKEGLSAQLFASSAESKYEALKNTQMLSAQMAECCCDVKEKICGVSGKMDDTLRTLDSNRLRDSLNVANNEVNMFRMYERFDDRRGGYHHHHHDERRRSRSPDRRRGGGGGGD